jgi:photosystem II stability/assembly factor-like uncharacterized protein
MRHTGDWRQTWRHSGVGMRKITRYGSEWTRPSFSCFAGVVLVVLLLSGTGPSALATVRAATATSHATVRWTEQAPYPAPIGELSQTACISVATCVAIGSVSREPQEIPVSVVATTSDDGQIWTSEPLPISAGLSGLSCPSGALCVAVGGHNGGGGTSTNPNRLGTAILSTDEGRSWTVSLLPKAVGYLNDVSCASDSFCLAVGETPDGTGAAAIVTTNEGATWSRVTLPSEEEGLSLVACPVPGTCLAVGERILRTTDGGQEWTDEGPSEGEGISCATITNCVLVGANEVPDGNPTPAIETTDDGGVTWTALAPSSPASANSSGALQSVSCGSPTFCMAVGGGIGPRGGLGVGVVFVTTDGGFTWAPRSTPAGMGGLEGVACVGSGDCVVNGSDPAAVNSLSALTSDGGYVWTTRSVAVGIGGIEAVTCPAPLECVAVGTNASTTYALRTKDGGRSWSAQSMAAAVVSLSAVSCGSSSDCVAVGSQPVPGQQFSDAFEGAVVATSDGGLSWRVVSLPSGVASLSAVSCATATRCLALGAPSGPVPAGSYQVIAIATRNGGSTWSPPVTIPAASAVQGLSCSTASSCVAVGQQFPTSPPGPGIPVAEVTRDGGKVWDGHPLPGRGEEPTGISCASSSRCVAVGAVTHGVLSGSTLQVSLPAGAVVPGALMISSDGGVHWSLSTKLGVGNLVGVSCPSPTSCTAVGRNRAGTGPVLLTGDPGQTPLSIAQPINGSGSLLGVSCHTIRFCELVGQSAFGGDLILRARTQVR